MKVTFVTGSGNLVLSIYTKIEMLMIIDKKKLGSARTCIHGWRKVKK